MDPLQIFYRNWIKGWTVFIALFTFPIINFGVLPLFHLALSWLSLSSNTETAEKLIGKILTSTLVISFIFLGGEWLIRKRIWKWIRPDLDISGDWLGETFYEELQQPSPTVKARDFVPFSKTHDVYIEQDCLNLAIKTSKGVSFANWGSETATLDKDCRLKFLYWVNYSDRSIFPETAQGFEDLAPTKHEESGRRGKPVLLTGSFYHCAGLSKPIYSGKTVFIRKNFEKAIVPDDLQDFAQKGKLSERLLKTP